MKFLYVLVIASIAFSGCKKNPGPDFVESTEPFPLQGIWQEEPSPIGTHAGFHYLPLLAPLEGNYHPENLSSLTPRVNW